MTENQRLWVEALRSGKFQQARGCLEDRRFDTGVKNCCLGVACRLALEYGVQMVVDTSDESRTRFDGDEAILPLEVSHWLGIGSDQGLIKEEYRTQAKALIHERTGKDLDPCHLAYLNDQGVDFETIALIIEKGWVW